MDRMCVKVLMCVCVCVCVCACVCLKHPANVCSLHYGYVDQRGVKIQACPSQGLLLAHITLWRIRAAIISSCLIILIIPSA